MQQPWRQVTCHPLFCVSADEQQGPYDLVIHHGVATLHLQGIVILGDGASITSS